MSERKMKQQGDIFFIPVGNVRLRSQVSVEKYDQELHGYILVRGEQTGHAHVVVAEPMEDVRVVPASEVVSVSDMPSHLEDGAKLAFIIAPDGTRVEHDQHDTEFLEKGNWLVMQQRQHDPDSERRPIPRNRFD